MAGNYWCHGYDTCLRHAVLVDVYHRRRPRPCCARQDVASPVHNRQLSICICKVTLSRFNSTPQITQVVTDSRSPHTHSHSLGTTTYLLLQTQRKHMHKPMPVDISFRIHIRQCHNHHALTAAIIITISQLLSYLKSDRIYILFIYTSRARTCSNGGYY